MIARVLEHSALLGCSWDMLGWFSSKAPVQDDFTDPSVVPVPYHQLSVANELSGYLGRLDRNQYQALQDLKQFCHERSFDLSKFVHGPAETEDHLLLRFLRARSFDQAKARTMLEGDIEWRMSNNIYSILSLDTPSLHQCDPVDVQRVLPIIHSGFDKQGRPVIFKKMGRSCVIDDLLAVSPVGNLVRFHSWCQEKAIELCKESSDRLGVHVETAVFVIDAEGWSIKLASRTAYDYLRQIADMDNLHYPERLGQVYIINSPSALAIAWGIISRWLDPVTRNKINFLRGKNEYEPALLQLMEAEELLECYGGKKKVEEWEWGAMAGVPQKNRSEELID
eukprot:c7787_g1_i1.p1 GENE.c7787_g1_i1~~c7787_g1_i1.p1  ORF type:complete len:337 (-),score=65.58 c7787_g1_i1:38-1048(-)